MCVEEIEEKIFEMYSLSESYMEARQTATDIESEMQGMYDEISSLIEEYGFEIDLDRFDHILESSALL
jgi:hypothetical protein